MVGPTGHPLTKLGFRRDIRLFLTVLGAFFVVLVIALVITLQGAMRHARDAQWQQWNAVADRAAEDLRSAAMTGGSVPAVLTSLRSRYGVAQIDVAGPRGTFSEGNPPDERAAIGRRTPLGALTLTFDAQPLARMRRQLEFTAAISLAAAAVGLIMLLLYIPRITRPIEQMLDHAGEIGTPDAGVDEQEFLINTFRDSIAKLKAQQEELRQLHDAQKLRADEFERVTAALTRSLTSGLIAIDAHGRVADVNQAGRDILRCGDTKLTGLSVREALGDSALADGLATAVERHAVLTRHELTTAIAGGEEITVGLTTVPLVGEENVYLGMLALFTDLTDIRQLESRVHDLQSLADLGEMSAGIAHEFRNSLATILGYLRLAQKQPSAEEMRARIERAEHEAATLGSAIDSLLNFARPMNVDAHPTDLREVVDGVIDRLEAYADGVAVNVEGKATVPADRALVSRAVENVLRNAIDAVRETGREGRIDIDIDSAPPSIRVADSGVGIDPEAASRIFLPFQSRKPNGLGLGLPLARKIVLLHGGAIRVAPRAEGGTVVTMEFGSVHPEQRSGEGSTERAR